ncbi:hypothetical protein [Sorangium sp. So ce388]|uniref:hypothetical protein n=1 Tax=Sorangium sp. So ce388 TaxID=3133309 RepID=UPI003F5C6BAC
MTDRNDSSRAAPIIDLAAAREHVRTRDGSRRTLTIDVDTVKLGISPAGGLLLKWEALVGGKWTVESHEVPPKLSADLAGRIRRQQAHVSRETYYATHPDARPAETPRREGRPRCGLSRDGTLHGRGRCRRARLHDGPCRGVSGVWAKVCAHPGATTKVWVVGEAGAQPLPPPATCGYCGATLLDSARARSR